jgi:hypothetical protein
LASGAVCPVGNPPPWPPNNPTPEGTVEATEVFIVVLVNADVPPPPPTEKPLTLPDRLSYIQYIPLKLERVSDVKVDESQIVVALNATLINAVVELQAAEAGVEPLSAK